MASQRRWLALCALAVAATAAPSSGQFVGPNGFTVRNQVTIRKPPREVYAAILQVGQWWDANHTYSGDAKNLSLDARPGGCFCERLDNGGGVEHMRVVYAAPGEMLRMSGALGPLQSLGVNGMLSLKLTPSGGVTTLELTYAVGGFSEAGFNQLAPAVSGVLTGQINRLRSWVETGTAR